MLPRRMQKQQFRRPNTSEFSVTRIAQAVGVVVMLACVIGPANAQKWGPLPERVTFPSADGHTMLIGYLYEPSPKHAAQVPAQVSAIVMMHGRGGAYSSLAKGRHDASTLSQRHQMWGHFWSLQGYYALMVDGFGPRGHGQGFPQGSYEERPAELNEVTVRPLDAYGALTWLRKRGDVLPNGVGLHGWSNGGSATLAAMALGTSFAPAPGQGFAAAIAYYPACGLKGQFESGLKPYAPVRVFHGTADKEVSFRRCRDLVERGNAAGGDIQIKIYPGAVHGFDDPSPSRQSAKANANAMADSMQEAQRFFARYLPGAGSGR